MDDSDLLSKKLEEQRKRITKKGLIRNYINEIIPNLFLGDLNGALDNKDNFDLIINLSKFPYSSKAIMHTFDIDDHPGVNIIEPLEKCIPIINEGLKENKKILVHCLMGKSRSASIILGYLMKTNKLDYDTACQIINQKREYPIEPNIGFMVQLKKHYQFK
jgi:protein-tyrosine phosphatase